MGRVLVSTARGGPGGPLWLAAVSRQTATPLVDSAVAHRNKKIDEFPGSAAQGQSCSEERRRPPGGVAREEDRPEGVAGEEQGICRVVRWARRPGAM